MCKKVHVQTHTVVNAEYTNNCVYNMLSGEKAVQNFHKAMFLAKVKRLKIQHLGYCTSAMVVIQHETATRPQETVLQPPHKTLLQRHLGSINTLQTATIVWWRKIEC